jgi:hypothetical protein
MRSALQKRCVRASRWASLNRDAGLSYAISRFYSWGPGSASAGSNGMLTCHAQPNSMSAIGTKQTCSMRRRMSTFGSKTDVDPALLTISIYEYTRPRYRLSFPRTTLQPWRVHSLPHFRSYGARIACGVRRRAYLYWVFLPFGPTRLPKGRWPWEFLSP